MISPVIVALDYATPEAAVEFAQTIDPKLCRLKIGKELFTRGGPAMVERIQALGFQVFLDLKFHDIPNTVAGAIKAAADMGVWMVNVHASNGRSALTAAADALSQFAQRPLLTAVTVLTSLSEQELAEIHPGERLEKRVSRLAQLADECGLDGVVCSPLEVTLLREQRGQDFLLVTPGVRPAGSAKDDQTRILTPPEAISAGSSHLVIGRPITQALDPNQALDQIIRSLHSD